MTASPSWRAGNHLLDRLPADVRDRLQPHLQPIDLPVGKVLYESEVRQRHIYFPQSGVISLVYVVESGASGEIAMVGNEGVVGVSVLVDSIATPTRGEVQVAGDALMLRSDIVEREFAQAGAFQLMILRYTQLMISQIAQAVICNRHHAMERQACRWLLSAFDRIDGNELALTQEAIAQLLGVRRESISEVARRLQAAGVLRYSRGRIHLLDRPALERRSCECYRLLRGEYDRLLVARAAA
ncbi:MAG TPA: Crp/Fnr family transcriptional regulator [Xanthomonadaceae bacterium]|jgi:CRP-like cAMP-binding protein|nr:Crp/Fnr family transcriptional regulator [Xanthomonadaceae bacterium]